MYNYICRSVTDLLLCCVYVFFDYDMIDVCIPDSMILKCVMNAEKWWKIENVEKFKKWKGKAWKWNMQGLLWKGKNSEKVSEMYENTSECVSESIFCFSMKGRKGCHLWKQQYFHTFHMGFICVFCLSCCSIFAFERPCKPVFLSERFVSAENLSKKECYENLLQLD